MPANLYQRGAIWWARIQINGRDQRCSLRTTDRAEARRRLKTIIEGAGQERAGIKPAGGGKTWQDAVARWIEVKLEGRKEATRKRYLVSIRQLDPFLRHLAVEDIDQPTLNEYVAARMGAGVTGATVRRDLTVVSSVWKVAKRAGWASGANPALEELDEIEEMRDPVRPVDVREIATVAARAGASLGPVIRFLARTGCRQEEAAGLEWSQVDLAVQPPTCSFIDTKTRSPRVIELTPQVARDLRRQPRQNSIPYVFWHRHSGDPDRYRRVSTLFKRLVTELSEARPAHFRPFRCHDLRHTYAIRWLQRGGDIYALSRQLGHSTVDTTDRVYGGWLRRDRRQARA